METITEKPMDPEFIYNTATLPKAQGTLQKGGQDDCNNHRTEKSGVRLCLLETAS